MRGARAAAAPVIALAACLVLACASGAAASDLVYVLSQTAAQLSVIDGESRRVVRTATLDKAPAAMTVSGDGGTAYVTHPELGQVAVVDLAAMRVTRRIAVRGSPFGIAVARSGRIYVGDWSASHVSVIAPDGTLPEAEVEVGRAPAHLLLAADETLLFVANRESDSVTAIRTDTHDVRVAIPVGRAPFAMALSPDGLRLYVGNVQGGSTSVIDTRALAVTETLESGAMPYGAAVTPDGLHLLITSQQSGRVAVIGKDGAALFIKVGDYPEGVAISADGARAYVANWFSDDVSVLDLATRKEVARIKCPGGPRSVAIVQARQ